MRHFLLLTTEENPTDPMPVEVKIGKTGALSVVDAERFKGDQEEEEEETPREPPKPPTEPPKPPRSPRS